MSTVLAIDTSATPVSCALLREGRLLASHYSHTGLTHSQTLLPMIEQVLADAALTVDKLDALAVNAGPGSFTGVRIGVATVKGLAFAHKIPCVSVSTLACMAEGFAGMPGEAVIACVMDARCRQVYAALFKLKGGQIERLTPDEAISVDELQNRLKNVEFPIILVGDGSEMCYTILKDELCNLTLAPLALRYQNAVATAAIASRLFEAGETVPADKLLPTYLRLPQAERELRQRQQAAENK